MIIPYGKSTVATFANIYNAVRSGVIYGILNGQIVMRHPDGHTLFHCHISGYLIVIFI